MAEQTPLVLALVAMIQRQAEELASLRDEIQRMKGTTVRPKIAPIPQHPLADGSDACTCQTKPNHRRRPPDLLIDQTQNPIIRFGAIHHKTPSFLTYHEVIEQLPKIVISRIATAREKLWRKLAISAANRRNSSQS